MNEIAANPFAMSAPAASRQQTNAVSNTDQQRAVAEVQAAMMIARMNPRDPIAAMDRILNACARPTLAEAAVYQYSRGGSDVSGPSIRLAEAMAQSWGNMQFGIRELDQRNGESTVQAFAWDVETNTRREVTFQIPHVRHTKKGQYKLEDPRDIYEMVANQGARRLRACILAVIPGDVTEAAVTQCEVTMKTKADTSPEAMKKMLEAFAAYDVTKEQIEARIQRRLDAIQPAQVVSLKKIYASLRDGMSSAADWFEATEGATDGAQKKDALPPYPAATFAGNLPKWAKLIEAGKKSSADIIAMASTKGTLSDEQRAAINAAGNPDEPTVTFTAVAEAISKATDADTLDVARDLIGAVSDAGQRAKLVALADQRAADLDE